MHELGPSGDAGYSGPPCVTSGPPTRCLLLYPGERRIRDIEMPELLTGELKLLTYLGSIPWTWHSSDDLAREVYARKDPAGRQLVWTYASLLRRKVARELPTLIALCRRRGYSCQVPVKVVEAGAATKELPYTR